MKDTVYFAHLVSFFLVLFSSVGLCEEKTVVYWPYFDFPPQFITTGPKPEGMGIDVARAIQAHLPEYDHVFIDAPPSRIIKELKAGRLLAVSGMLDTPARHEIAVFSELPCRMTFTMMVIMREGDKYMYASDGHVDLQSLFRNPQLRFGFVPNMDYGPLAEDIQFHLHDVSRASAVVAAKTPGQLLDMLLLDRIDWFVHDSLGFWYAVQGKGLEGSVGMVQAEGHPPSPVFGSVACPRTDAGHLLMSRINKALVSIINSGELEGILAQWIPEQLYSFYKRAYTENILLPASRSRWATATSHEFQETSFPVQ